MGLGSVEPLDRAADDDEHLRRVPAPHRFGVVDEIEPLGGIRAHGVRQTEPHGGASVHRADEVVVDEGREVVEHVDAADGLGGVAG